MPAKKVHIPKYCYHKRSKQAYVRIGGKFHYLGEYDSTESREKYGKLIAEHAANPTKPTSTPEKPCEITVVEVIAAYLDHASQYYIKDGKPTGHMSGLRAAMRILRELYGSTPAVEFGPLSLRAIQHALMKRNHARKYINDQCANIKRMVKWAVSMEILPPSTHQALATVPGLKRGRSEARETEPIMPVDDKLVEATLPHMSDTVADMVRTHRLLGCRPSELCMMRPRDIDATGDVWTYRPASHKTEHHGRDRVIYIGPKTQEILRPYLDRDPEAHCFSPIESEERRRAKAHAERKTPLAYGNSRGTNKRKKPKRMPRTFYDKDSYNRAIRRATEKGNEIRTKEAKEMGIEPQLLPRWTANQLRHSRATEVRRDYGLEAAQVICGHASADITQTYAERDAALAVSVARKSG